MPRKTYKKLLMVNRKHPLTPYAYEKWIKKWLDVMDKKATILIKQQNNKCIYCECDLAQRVRPKPNFSDLLPRNFPTLDHKIPVSSGGTDTLNNLVIACHRCNLKRKVLNFDEFFELTRPLREMRGVLTGNDYDFFAQKVWSRIYQITANDFNLKFPTQKQKPTLETIEKKLAKQKSTEEYMKNMFSWYAVYLYLMRKYRNAEI